MNAREEETLLQLYDLIPLVSARVLTLEQANEQGYRMLEQLKHDLDNPAASRAENGSNVNAASTSSSSRSSAAPLVSTAAAPARRLNVGAARASNSLSSAASSSVSTAAPRRTVSAASTSNSLSSAAASSVSTADAPRRNDTSSGQRPLRGRKRTREPSPYGDFSPCWDFIAFVANMASRYVTLFPSRDRRGYRDEATFPVNTLMVKMCDAYFRRQRRNEGRRQ